MRGAPPLGPPRQPGGLATLPANANANANANAAAERLRILVAGLAKQIYLPVLLADRLGHFKDQGLEVGLLSQPAGMQAEDALLAGAVQGVVGFYDHAISLQARGAFVHSVVQQSQAPGEARLVASRHDGAIRSPPDFAGRRLGVTGQRAAGAAGGGPGAVEQDH